MNKFIVKVIKQKLEDKQLEWAATYVAKVYQNTLDTPEARKQVESANLNMQVIESTIAFLKDLLKKESKEK